ncbi:hypothetical protein HK097_005372, partial [Rhizophlyctis rosea]
MSAQDSASGLVRELDPPEEATNEALQFKSLQIEAKLNTAKDGDGNSKSYPPSVNLLAISNKYGFVVYGISEGFAYAYLADLRTTLRTAPKSTTVPFEKQNKVLTPGRTVHHLRLSADELTLFVVFEDGAFRTWDVRRLGAGEQAEGTEGDRISDQPIIDFCPNPEAHPDMWAAVDANKQVYIGEKDKKLRAITKDVTSICWSPKGKQLVCGTSDGRMLQVTPDGTVKNVVGPPAGLGDAKRVTTIAWLENTLWYTCYATEFEGQEVELEPYVISQDGTPKTTTYRKLDHATYPEEPEEPDGPKDAKLFVEVLKNWGGKGYNLILGDPRAPEFGYQGQTPDTLDWTNWDIDDTSRVSIPMTEDGKQPYVIGTALD